MMLRQWVITFIVFLGGIVQAYTGTLILNNRQNQHINIYDINYKGVKSAGSSTTMTVTGLPNKPLMLSATLDIAGFGKLTFSAANGGDGFIANSQTLYVLYEFARHRYLRANEVLTEAESQGYVFDAAIHTQMSTALNYLNQSEAASNGSAAEANYALSSLQYSCPASESIIIELGRQKLDQQGGVRPDQWISCNSIYESSEGQPWRDAMYPLFTAGVPFFSWPWQWEGEGVYTSNFMNEDGTVSRLTSSGKHVRGHALCWLWGVPPVYTGQPPFDPVTLEHLKTSHADYADYMVNYYPEIENWVIGNEFHSWGDLDFLQPEDSAQILKEVGLAVGAANPAAIRGVVLTVLWGEDSLSNLGSTPRVVSPYEFYEILNAAGVPYEYIGMQLYSNDRDLFEVHELLETYSKLGKRIRACELQASAYDYPQPGNRHFPNGNASQTYFRWHRDWDPQLQADWLEGMFLVCLSKDYVDEWNWWDLAEYEDNYYPWGGLCDADYNKRPSYFRLEEMVERWGQRDKICTVNFNDLVGFSEGWLAGVGSIADLDADETVGLSDFAVIAQNWLGDCPNLGYLGIQSWDVASDWSDNSNPNGVWSYAGFTPWYSYKLRQTHQSQWQAADLGPNQPAWADAPDAEDGWCRSIGASGFDFPSGKVGIRGEAILRWTSPIAGLINISGSLWFMDNCPGCSQSWIIRRNNQTITSGSLTSGYSSSSPLSFASGIGGAESLVLAVTTGDTIDLLFYDAYPVADYTGVNFTITEVADITPKPWPWCDPQPAPRQVYSLAADWSDLLNPNDAWSYGEYVDSVWGTRFNVLSQKQTAWLAGDLGANQPAWAVGATDVPGWCKSIGGSSYDLPAGRVACHGPAVVRWTATGDGEVDISGGVWLIRNLGRNMTWELRQNGATFTSGTLTWGATSGNPLIFSTGTGGAAALRRTVKPGETIDLYLHKAPGVDWNDFVGVELGFTYVE